MFGVSGQVASWACHRQRVAFKLAREALRLLFDCCCGRLVAKFSPLAFVMAIPNAGAGSRLLNFELTGW
jgi:hypothetical protein